MVENPDPSFSWGSIVRLRRNMRHPIKVDNEGVVFIADVLVPDDAENHTPKDPPPDISVKKGGGVPLTEDGVYVVQVDSNTDHRLTLVVDTDLGASDLTDTMAAPEEIA